MSSPAIHQNKAKVFGIEIWRAAFVAIAGFLLLLAADKFLVSLVEDPDFDTSITAIMDAGLILVLTCVSFFVVRAIRRGGAGFLPSRHIIPSLIAVGFVVWGLSYFVFVVFFS